MSAAPTIALDGVCFSVGGRVILDRIDATIPSQGVTAIVGPNGAGKSVLLRLMDGLLQPTAGSIRVGTERRAFVFQRPGLVRASVARNVALALSPMRLSRRARADRVTAALARVGLGDRAEAPATKLSGGEQQRLALARAWATEPRLLLLDEPTANLDPGATESVERLIAGMAQAGAKVILVSHNLGQVTRLAQDVIVLSAGRAVEHGPTRQTILTPRTAQARAYLTGELPWVSFAAAS